MPVSSAKRTTVTKGGEPLGLLGASRRITATCIRRWPQKVTACAVAFAVLVAFGLRAFRIGVSWEVQQDEMDYLQISQGVVRTLWVIGYDGGPFYLHPPLFFFLQAAYIKLFGAGWDLIHQIYNVRYLVAAFGGLSAGALLWTGRRLAGWPAGIAAAAIFALDPFCIRMNSRDFLEASTVLWILLGYSVLFSGLILEDRRSVSRRRTAVAGVLFGLALLTKENAAFVTLLPLGICFVLGWALPRTRSALIGVVALIVYAPYPWFVYAIGDWDTFLNQKLNGLWRLAGLLQVTGFNQQGGPSLLETLIHRLDKFATTYALLATGAVAICLLLLTDLGKAPARRLLLTWTSSAYAYLAYAMVFGTLEEHFYYYLVIPCILMTSVTAFLLIRKMRAEYTGSRSTSAAPRVRVGQLALVEAGVVIYPVAIVTRLNDFVTTLLFLVTGILAVYVLLFTDWDKAPVRRLLAAWTAIAYIFLTYIVAFGTLEEQFFYFLVVPCILVMSVTTFLLIRKMRAEYTGSRSTSAAPRVRARRLALVEAGAVVFAVALAFWSVYIWVLVHTVPDNGYEHVASYVDQLPEDSRVAVTSATAAHIMPDRPEHYSVETLRADNIEYVVISSYLAERGWNEPAAEIYQWVKGHGQLVYGFEGDSSGLLGVWRLPDHTDSVANLSEE